MSLAPAQSDWVRLLREQAKAANDEQYAHDRRYYNHLVTKGKIERGSPMYPYGRSLEDFDPESARSVLDNRATVVRCLNSLRESGLKLPPIERLPAAILRCRNMHLYLAEWRRA